ncbi:uncharacterized protein [Aristolochia californica]|uniref:uncharacterized protein isoform X1 n=1 Tax=Aristolochia californica TaxID=171875 RepID=UPI0035D8F75E
MGSFTLTSRARAEPGSARRLASRLVNITSDSEIGDRETSSIREISLRNPYLPLPFPCRFSVISCINRCPSTGIQGKWGIWSSNPSFSLSFFDSSIYSSTISVSSSSKISFSSSSLISSSKLFLADETKSTVRRKELRFSAVLLHYWKVFLDIRTAHSVSK